MQIKKLSVPQFSLVIESLKADEIFSLETLLYDLEELLLIKALNDAQGIKRRAAALLMLKENTFRMKLKRFGITYGGGTKC